MNDCVLALSAPGVSRVSERRARPAGVGGPRRRGGGVAPRRVPGAPGPAPRLPAAPHRRGRPVCFALYYHFQRTTNSGTSWNIWKTQISRKKRQRTGLEGLKSCPSVISTTPRFHFGEYSFRLSPGKWLQRLPPRPASTPHPPPQPSLCVEVCAKCREKPQLPCHRQLHA